MVLSCNRGDGALGEGEGEREGEEEYNEGCSGLDRKRVPGGRSAAWRACKPRLEVQSRGLGWNVFSARLAMHYEAEEREEETDTRASVVVVTPCLFPSLSLLLSLTSPYWRSPQLSDPIENRCLCSLNRMKQLSLRIDRGRSEEGPDRTPRPRLFFCSVRALF